MSITIGEELINQIIESMKQIKPEGYDSMERLVGLVGLFGQMKQEIRAEEERQKQAAQAQAQNQTPASGGSEPEIVSIEPVEVE